MEVLNFEDCLNLCEDKRNISLFVGNGFSIDLRKEIFTYQKLFDKANFDDCKVKLNNLFEELDTFDFEKVISALNNTISVLNNYSSDVSNVVKDISTDVEYLKTVFCTVISNTHPAIHTEIKDNEKISCRKFLTLFNKIFTINYDLLLYWCLLADNFDHKHGISIRTNDGFGYNEGRKYLEWKRENWADQNIFYIHGALHFYEWRDSVTKSKAEESSPIVDQIKNSIKCNRYPLLVMEGNYKKKLEKINQVRYLRFCYDSLGVIKENLFIFGFSFSENDHHIVQKIRENPYLKKIFISIRENNPEKIKNLETKANYINSSRSSTNKIEFVLFIANTARIWNKI